MLLSVDENRRGQYRDKPAQRKKQDEDSILGHDPVVHAESIRLECLQKEGLADGKRKTEAEAEHKEIGILSHQNRFGRRKE